MLILGRPQVTIAMLCAGLLILGCGPHHTCRITGTPILTDGAPRMGCELGMYVGDREDALFTHRVYSGEPFEILVSLPIIEPALEHHAQVQCPGYQTADTRVFKLGVGWMECAPVVLGEIHLTTANTARDGAPR